jgi:hypothetical protein
MEEMKLKQYPNKERFPLRLIMTEVNDMENPRTYARITWWTRGEAPGDRSEWNMTPVLGAVGLDPDILIKDIREDLLVQWRLQFTGDVNLLPWPDDIITVVEEHSTVVFFKERDDAQDSLISMPEVRYGGRRKPMDA